MLTGRRQWLLLLSLLLIVSESHLRAQTRQKVSLDALVDSAKDHFPLLKQKLALINSAKTGITDARNSFLPTLTIGDEISVGTANDVEGGYLPIGGIIRPISSSIRAGNNYSAQSDNLASIYAQYDLVNFGLRGAKISNARAYANLQQADFDKTFYVLKMQIGKLYFDILKNTYLLDIDRQNVNRYQSIYTIISALTSTGIKAGVDSSLALAELSKTRVVYNQRAGVINQLRQQLSFLTGISVTQLAIDTATNKTIPSPAVLAPVDTTTNPLLNYYKFQRNIYTSDEQVVRKSYLPKIVVGAGGWGRGSSILYNDRYSDLNNGLGLQRFNYIVGIGITYDLFSPVHFHDKLMMSRYQTQAADANLEEQRQALINAALQADIAINTDAKNLQELPGQVKAATNAYQQKVAQYKAGVINLIDLLNASFVLYTTQTSFVETVNDWYTANLDKAAATGLLDQFIQTLKQ